MKLSATIALALSLSAVARPLVIPEQSKSDLIRREPLRTSEKGFTANLPQLDKRGDVVDTAASVPPWLQFPGPIPQKKTQYSSPGAKIKDDLTSKHFAVPAARRLRDEAQKRVNEKPGNKEYADRLKTAEYILEKMENGYREAQKAMDDYKEQKKVKKEQKNVDRAILQGTRQSLGVEPKSEEPPAAQ